MNKNEMLLQAADIGNALKVKDLLTPKLFGLIKPADIEARNKDQFTPLISASIEGHTEVAKVLIEKGADVNAKTNDHFTPLMACAKFGHKEIAVLLLEKGADVNASKIGEDIGETPLMFAAWKGNTDIAALLIDKGANVNATTPNGYNALMSASKFGNKDVAWLLLKHGAAVNSSKIGEDLGWTPLMFAAWKGHTNVAELLLEKGAEVDMVTATNWTPLLWAAREGHKYVVELLVRKGAKIDHVQKDGWTALILASFNGYAEIVRILLDSGANINVKDSKGETAMDSAVEKKFNEIIDLLVKFGAVAPEKEESKLPEITSKQLSIVLRESRTLGNAGVGGSFFQDAIQNMNNRDDDAAERNFKLAIERGVDVLRQGYVYANLGSIRLKKNDLAGAIDCFINVLNYDEALYESVHDASQYLYIVYSELRRTNEADGLKQLSNRTSSQLGYSLASDVAGKVRQLVKNEREKFLPTKKSNNKPKPADITKGLRPLGNKNRLTHCEGDDAYDAYFLLFRDKDSAELYYNTFIKYAEKNPPPFLIEVMVAYAPKTIFAEKYAFTYPNPRADNRESYQTWAREAILTCNDTLRPHSNTDSKYKALKTNVEVVYKWDILVPSSFDIESPEAKELLSDPENGGYPEIQVFGQEGVVIPEKPQPEGPWIGIPFEISKFEEAFYGRAATRLFMKIVGIEQLQGTVIHGGDLLPECRYWCVAIHTNSKEQALYIEKSILESDESKLNTQGSRVLWGSQIPVNTMPFQGFISKEGVYVGL